VESLLKQQKLKFIINRIVLKFDWPDLLFGKSGDLFDDFELIEFLNDGRINVLDQGLIIIISCISSLIIILSISKAKSN